MPHRHLHLHAPIAVAILLAAVFSLFAVRTPDPTTMIVDGDDLVGDFYPSRVFSNSELLHGRIPLWNPDSFCGTPFLAEGQAGVFDPLHLLLLPLSVPLGLNLYALLHLLGAGGATYLYVRRLGARRTAGLVAATAFCMGGWPLGRLQGGHYPILPFQTFLPLALWGWETWRQTGRRSGLGVVILSVAALALAGHSQMLVYTAIFLAATGLFEFVVEICRRRFRHGLTVAGGLGVACVAAGLLAAVQLLPTLDLGRYCSRPQMSFEFCSMYSLGPESLATLLAPRLFGGPHTGLPYWGRWNPWEMTTYAGLVPLLLACLAVARVRSSRVLFHALVCLVAGALALGEHTPLLRLVYHLVPMFRMFRAWCRCAFFLQFSICVLAGLGADRLLNAGDSRRGRADRAVLMGLLAGVLVAVWGLVLWLLADGAGVPEHWMRLLTWRKSLGQMPNDAPFDLIDTITPLRWEAVRALSATLFVAVAALAVLPRWPRLLTRPRLAQWVLLLLVVPDVWSYALTRLDFVPTDKARFAPEFVEALRAEPQAGRLLKGPLGRPANQAMVSGLEEVTGYTGVLTLRCNDFLTAALGISREAQASWPPVDHITPALLKPNVAFVILPRYQYCPGQTKVLVAAGNNELRRVQDAAPRAYFAKSITACATADQALDEARSGRWLSNDIVETSRTEALAGVAQVSPHGQSGAGGNEYGESYGRGRSRDYGDPSRFGDSSHYGGSSGRDGQSDGYDRSYRAGDPRYSSDSGYPNGESGYPGRSGAPGSSEQFGRSYGYGDGTGQTGDPSAPGGARATTATASAIAAAPSGDGALGGAPFTTAATAPGNAAPASAAAQTSAPAPAATTTAPAVPADAGFVRIMESEPSRVLVMVQTAVPRLLVLNDSYDAHWRCTLGGAELLDAGLAPAADAAPKTPRPIAAATPQSHRALADTTPEARRTLQDGAPEAGRTHEDGAPEAHRTLEILPVNINFRGVVVPPGRHVLEFAYDPRPFRIGAAISLLTLLALIVTALVEVEIARRRRVKQDRRTREAGQANAPERIAHEVGGR